MAVRNLAGLVAVVQTVRVVVMLGVHHFLVVELVVLGGVILPFLLLLLLLLVENRLVICWVLVELLVCRGLQRLREDRGLMLLALCALAGMVAVAVDRQLVLAILVLMVEMEVFHLGAVVVVELRGIPISVVPVEAFTAGALLYTEASGKVQDTAEATS